MATKEHRVAPLGWTTPEVSVLTGVPARTLQVWRKGFFVPALPPEVTGHGESELYGLGDLIAVRVMRMLLDAGVDREVVARVGEELPAWEDRTFWPFRTIATAGWWYLVPASSELLHPAEDVIRVWTDGMLTETCATNDDIQRDGDLVWLCPEGERVAVWFPLSAIAAELSEKADQWRRQRRIATKRWPPWM